MKQRSKKLFSKISLFQFDEFPCVNPLIYENKDSRYTKFEEDKPNKLYNIIWIISDKWRM